uniref:UBX domain protein 11 n=1 Tax=Sus scrofa TaxID=9823 RepID=A0A8W4FN74_PIG
MRGSVCHHGLENSMSHDRGCLRRFMLSWAWPSPDTFTPPLPLCSCEEGLCEEEISTVAPAGMMRGACGKSRAQVSDLRDQVYPENGLDPFPGEGRVVGLQRIRKPWDRTEHPGSRMTAEKFLNRLPKFVIRQGEVIDIRGPIRDTLQNCCPLPARIQEIVVETPALAAERERSQKSPESPAPQLSMLRIKSENGEQAFLLMMRPEDTIGDVRVLLAQARAVDATTFEIFSTFPPTVYHDALTLLAAGLVPSATLLLRAHRAPRPAPRPE